MRESLGLARGERVLAAAATVDRGWLVATDRALRYGAERLPWESIAHAEWDHEARTLTVAALADDSAAARRLTVALDDPGLVPETVHERVMASIVVSRHVRLRGKAGIRVVGRRVAGSDELAWQAVADAGLDPADEQVRAAADEALRDLRREIEG